MISWPKYKTGSPREKFINLNSCRASKFNTKTIKELLIKRTKKGKVTVANLRRFHTKIQADQTEVIKIILVK